MKKISVETIIKKNIQNGQPALFGLTKEHVNQHLDNIGFPKYFIRIMDNPYTYTDYLFKDSEDNILEFESSDEAYDYILDREILNHKVRNVQVVDQQGNIFYNLFHQYSGCILNMTEDDMARSIDEIIQDYDMSANIFAIAIKKWMEKSNIQFEDIPDKVPRSGDDNNETSGN